MVVERMPSLLDDVVEAHGGAAHWRGINEVVARLDVRGWVFATHGLPYAYDDVEIRVRAHEVRTDIFPMGPRRERALYLPNRVEVGTEGRDQPRARMGTTHLRWDWLDLTYFAGF